MNLHSETRKCSDSKLELYRVRLIAKFCILLVCLVQCIFRLVGIFQNLNRGHTAQYIFKGCTFFGAMIILIGIEYIFYKRRRKILIRYSNIVDFVLLLFFIGDWVLSIFFIFQKVPTPPCFRINVIYGFTHFAWRTLLVMLIVQQWYLKVIPPVAAVIMTSIFAIHYSTVGVSTLVSLTIAQVISLIIIIYCEDKVKWKMMWINLQQEKWIQVSNFILNNIPENIMILDFKGEVRFVSDYCKSFMLSCNFSMNTKKEFFQKIQNLHHQQQQQNEVSIVVNPPSNGMQVEHLTTNNDFLPENTNLLRVETLEDLVMNFKRITEGQYLHEKQFLVYNGKLKVDNEDKERSIEIKISFVQHFKNEYIILILRDTTQRDLLVTLEETNKYKDQLLASVSHELRAPLNGTINMVEGAINCKKIPESIKETLLVPALRSSKFLLHLINDILDMSQIKEKKLRLAFQSGDLKETIKGSAQLVELQAKKKGIELLVEIDPNIPKVFCTDHIRLSQIILNLLNNGIKFTKEGVVRLVVLPIQDEPNWVQISVEDSGIGMTDDNVKKLFRNYTQIEFEGRQKMNPTGVGLGLNIAYNLVELLAPEGHGKINVSSAPDQGSTFTFTIENKEILHFEDGSSCWEHSDNLDECPGIIHLPTIHKNNTSKSNIPLVVKSEFSAIEIPSCSCPQILIVDDNPFNTMAFETILSSLEIKCDSVYSGSSAIKKLLNRETEKCDKEVCKQYSVVFMDQEMPEMSGIETTQEIKRLQGENKLSPLVKIIGCTAHQSKEEVERFMKAGLDKCIHKPITPMIVKDILNEFY